MINLHCVKHVYSIEPSGKRFEYARYVFEHFKSHKEKFTIINGNFKEIRLPEKVDLFVLCASIHHCYDDDIPVLFENMRKLLLPSGKILIANEHYVNYLWIVKRFISYLRHLGNKEKLGFGLKNVRAQHPFDGEHWRTRRELENIFKREGFSPEFHIHNGDLCKDKPSVYHQLGWTYYFAILDKKHD